MNIEKNPGRARPDGHEHGTCLIINFNNTIKILKS